MKNLTCKNCEEHFHGNFCPNCGQNAHEHRINAVYFIHDIPHSVFHVDNLFFSTFRGLFTKPGLVIREFLEGKRARYFRPFGYVVVLTALSTLLVKIFTFLKVALLQQYDPAFQLPEESPFFAHYFSLFIFLMIPFASLVTWAFFLKRKYNFWEHFLANTYIGAQLNFVWILIHLLNLIVILFVKHDFEFNFTIFFTFFMTLFLYLYGSVFGFLMQQGRSRLKLAIWITLMNLVLFFVFSAGFNLAGLM